MKTFCTDRDLLKYEPAIFSNEAFNHFIKVRGINATISGGYLSSNNVDFSQAGIGAGSVVIVRDDVGGWSGLYEVIQCVLAGQILISALRATANDEPIAPPDASGLKFTVISFDPIIYEVSLEIARYFSLKPAGGSNFRAEQIVNIDSLIPVACFATLARLFAILPLSQDEIANDRIVQKQDYYRNQYYKAREATALEIDATGDGLANIVLTAGITTKRG